MDFEVYFELIEKLKEIDVNASEDHNKIYDLQILVLERIIDAEKVIKTTKEEIKKLKLIKVESRNDKINLAQNIREKKDYIIKFKEWIKDLKKIIDALSYQIFSKYDMKNLGFEQNSGFISDKEGLSKELEALKKIFDEGGLAVLNDLTNCIKIGDIAELKDDKVNLIEIKFSDNTNYRIIRQTEKRNQINRYLQEDEFENFRDGKSFKRVYIGKEVNYIEELNVIIDEAYEKGVLFKKIEEGLYYLVMYKSDINRAGNVVKKLKEIKLKKVFFLNGWKYSKDFMNNSFINIFEDSIFYLDFRGTRGQVHCPKSKKMLY